MSASVCLISCEVCLTANCDSMILCLWRGKDDMAIKHGSNLKSGPLEAHIRVKCIYCSNDPLASEKQTLDIEFDEMLKLPSEVKRYRELYRRLHPDMNLSDIDGASSLSCFSAAA